MPNRYLQAAKHYGVGGDHGAFVIPFGLKGRMRDANYRTHTRRNMMARLQLQADLVDKARKELEIKALLDKQEFGATKPKRVRKPKVTE